MSRRQVIFPNRGEDYEKDCPIHPVSAIDPILSGLIGELAQNLPLYLQRVKVGERFVLQAGESIAEFSPIKTLRNPLKSFVQNTILKKQVLILMKSFIRCETAIPDVK